MISILLATIGLVFIGTLYFQLISILEYQTDNVPTYISFGRSAYLPLVLGSVGIILSIIALIKREKYKFIGLTLNLVLVAVSIASFNGFSFV